MLIFKEIKRKKKRKKKKKKNVQPHKCGTAEEKMSSPVPEKLPVAKEVINCA